MSALGLGRVKTCLRNVGPPARTGWCFRPRSRRLTTEFDKACTAPAKRQAVVLPEVSDRLVIASEPTQQPHDFDIASGLSFQPPARLHPVQIAVDAQLQENRWVVRRPTCCRRLNPLEAHLGQIEPVHKHRSREQDCSRQRNHRGIQAKASTAHDPRPEAFCAVRPKPRLFTVSQFCCHLGSIRGWFEQAKLNNWRA
jgi:hypothetical protein